MLFPVVVDVIVPVFGVVALGYIAGAFRWLDSAAVRGLSLYVFNIAIPLLLFKAMSTVTLPAQMPWDYVLGFFACALGSFLIVFWLMCRASTRPTGEVGVFAFGCSYGNFIPLGIPLAMTAFGEAATVPLFLLVAFQAPVFFAPMIFIQESAKQRERRGPVAWPVFKSIVANQYLLGIGLGAAVNLSELSLPGPISEIIALIGQSAVPCALFSLGCALSFYTIEGVLSRALTVVVVKNLLLPLLVWWVSSRLGLPPVWQAVMVLMAALPVGINTYLFAERYECGQALAGTAVVLSTAVSVVTLSIVLSVFA
ncbi:MAG TPA: AEC family transporter [Gammaproteobacteria bacterium]|nr:AEC family transporter [Gammaproteobacteria bacterium]